MKIKSIIILIVGAVVIGVLTMGATAEELTRENELPTEDISTQEYNPEEPVLIAPSPDSEPLLDEVSEEGEIIPLMDRDLPVPSGVTEEDGSEMSLISGLDTKNSDKLKNSNTPVIIILGVVGLLVILLLVINKRK